MIMEMSFLTLEEQIQMEKAKREQEKENLKRCSKMTQEFKEKNSSHYFNLYVFQIIVTILRLLQYTRIRVTLK